jgi:iron(III) transport system substrate-binding protein
VVAAATAEGRVSVSIPSGETYRRGVSAFQQAFPDIALEVLAISPSEFVPRLLQERAGDQYLWDVYIAGGSSMYPLAHGGILDPIQPELLLPEVVDDRAWRGGIAAAMLDLNKQYVFNFISYLDDKLCCVNRALISERDLPTFNEMWDPRFKGRIAWRDPRLPGAGVNSAALVLDGYGEKALRDLFVNQEVVATSNARQLAEWAIRGRYPIATGATEVDVRNIFNAEGIGLDVKPLLLPGQPRVAAGTGGAIAVVNKPPHPYARKVFVNWVLSPQGQTVLSQALGDNSRRADVPVVDPERLPPEGTPVRNTQSEEFLPVRERALEIAKEVIR